MDPILRCHQYMITSTNTFAQWGAVTALKGDQQPAYAMRDEFQQRRDFIHKSINAIPGFSCTLPEGAFYLFPSVKTTGLNGRQIADLLLEKAGVATVAGESFGRLGAGHIRISYANSMENLELAVEKINNVIINL
jgi:aspartate/methionine/tyrosine aminotransferase